MDLPGALRRALAGEPIAAAWLFGSQARGTARPGSDVDVAVLFGRGVDLGPAGEVLALEGRLEQSLSRRVQVVAVDDAPADLVHRVLRDGVLLVEPDRSARVAFEVRKRNEYFDMVPIWREYRRLPRGVEP